MSRTTIALIALVAALLAAASGWWAGVSHGKDITTAKHDADLVKELRGIFDSHTTLTDEANAASRALRQARGTRQATFQKTTQELTDALAPTADRRTDCVLPVDGVRVLSEAQRRAAAAAAGGFAAGLPATSGSASKR